MIEWRDMLTWPFERANCYALAEEVCRRAGIVLPPLCPNWADGEREVLSKLVCVGATTAAATEIGDLIISDPKRLGYASHVAVVVEPGMALSTSVESGPYAWRPSRHPCDKGVWRSTLRP